jgi:formate hydrogenlyase subunit 3/multisubunit Na+/H+ antiporter MnhD subunit
LPISNYVLLTPLFHPHSIDYFSDRLLAIYLFVFFTVLETVAIYAIGRSEKKDAAAALHRRARWFFPIAFLASMVVIVSVFLG